MRSPARPSARRTTPPIVTALRWTLSRWSRRSGSGIVVAALAGCLAASLWACGATRHPVSGVPGDFGLAITVLATRDEPGLPRPQRPAQYILEPDGTLRVAVGAGVDPGTFPPRTRRLDPRQVERLWTLVESAGLAADAAGTPVSGAGPGPSAVPSPPDGWAYVDVAASGQRHQRAIQLESNPAAQGVIDELASLAWIRP
ncbi:MAG: hypothetical protein R3B68_07085 [Phycisphaerales bacterium]